MLSLPHARAVLLAALLCSLAGVLWRSHAQGGPPLEISFLSVFACFGYASVAAHYLASDHDRRARASAAAIMGLVAAGAVAAGAALHLGLRQTAVDGLIALGSVGVAAYLREIAAAREHAPRRARLRGLRDALIVPLAVMPVPFFLWTNGYINPVYDARILGFEQILRFPFSTVAMNAYTALGPLALVPTACYLALPVGLSIVAVRQPASEGMTRVLVAAIIAGVAGFALYAICPAVGPVQAFGTTLPALGPDQVVPMTLTAHVPRNGMPSLHTVWALLILWNAARLGWRWRLPLTLFAALNVWAAIGHYQHWFIDLVVAVPLATALQAAIVDARPGAARRRAVAAAGAVIGLSWIVALRTGLLLGTPSWLAWLLVVLTVVVPAGLRHRAVQ